MKHWPLYQEVNLELQTWHDILLATRSIHDSWPEITCYEYRDDWVH